MEIFSWKLQMQQKLWGWHPKLLYKQRGFNLSKSSSEIRNDPVTVDQDQRAEGWVTAEKTLTPCQVRFLGKYQEFNEERIA